MHVGSLGYVPPVRTSTAAGKQNVGNLKNKKKLTKSLLPLQGFGPEAKTQGDTLEFPRCMYTRNFFNKKK